MHADVSGGQYPAELVQRDQWCLWRVESGKSGAPTKVPYRPDGRKAASNNATTWTTYAEACKTLAGQRDFYGGLGYFFSADDPVCGVDLDVSLDADGNPQPWATEIIAKFQDTYRAFSVSGLGIHILCKAKLTDRGRNFYVPDGPTDPAGKRAQIGLFDRGRFFALTGQVYQQAPLELTPHQETIGWLLGLMRPQLWMKPPEAKQSLTDSEILERARRAANGPKFARLWDGQWQPDYGSQSEADLALCCILAFWCGPDSSRIDGLFRQSGLTREKWLERKDYRDSTIAAALEQTPESYRTGKERLALNAGARATSPTTDTLPKICVGARQLPAISADALASLHGANDPPQLFAQSSRMVALVRDERGRQVIIAVTEAALRGRMARNGFYYKHGRDGERIECMPPLEVARDLLALAPSEWRFPPLEALAEAPFLRPDGSICDRPGYDSRTRLFYAPAEGLELADIPDVPMRDHVDVALELLDEVICDFPFANEASKANAIASMLTPLIRPAIDSPTPLALFDAPQAGTGKTLLAEVVAAIATGRAAETFSAPSDPEEWRKKITTALCSRTNVVVIDNVTHRLDSEAFCMALTASTVSDRQFRTFDTIVLPVRCAWIATGNNIQLGGDMPRRCYWIRLDAMQSKPFSRTGFRHGDLRSWVRQHRAELIVALLTIARYWYVQGRPEAKTVKPLGSFEAWCNVVGGMLELAGIKGFLANADIMIEHSDSDAVQWEAFLLRLDELFQEPFRAAEVFEKLTAHDTGVVSEETKHLRASLPDFIADAADRTGGFFQRRLGKCFAERNGRRFGESQISVERAEMDRKYKVQRWRVVKP